MFIGEIQEAAKDEFKKGLVVQSLLQQRLSETWKGSFEA